MDIKCPACNQENHQPDGLTLRFCQKCGEKLPEAVAEQDSADGLDSSKIPKELKIPSKKNKKRWMIPVFSVLAGIVLATVGLLAKDYIIEFFTDDQQPEVVETEAGYDTITPFRVSVPGKGYGRAEGVYQSCLDRLENLSDAPIKWSYLSSSDTAGALKDKIASGKYPEVVLGNYFTAEDISKYSEDGVLIPLDEYINPEDTPNIWSLYEKRPEIRAASVAPDGHIYTLPGVDEFGPDYLESVIWINKTWLDQLNLRVPTTLAELKRVLKAFKERDPNGNGLADEIPMTFQVSNSQSYPEALLSCWGISAKYGTYDSWLTVQNGEVKFAPILNEWKRMIAFYRDLYAEGLLDGDAFTHNSKEFQEKLASPVSTVGVVWAAQNPMWNAEEYIAIAPFGADRRTKPAWWIHPDFKGTRDAFCVFKSCKNPGAAIRWIDKMYDFENSVQNTFGEYDFAISQNEEGTIIWNQPPEEETINAYVHQCVLSSDMPGTIFKEDYGTKIELSLEQQEKMSIYHIYEKHLDDEVWPRPYCTVEETAVITDLSSDIFEMVSAKMTAWVIGAEDLEASWDQYLIDLEQMGVLDLLSIYQTAYARYLEALSRTM